jgi:uncharacterized protein
MKCGNRGLKQGMTAAVNLRDNLRNPHSTPNSMQSLEPILKSRPIALGKCLAALAVLMSVLLPSASLYAGELDDAVAAYNRNQYGKAYPIFRKLAMAGDADAQFRLGGLYFKGQGVKQNSAEAVNWFQKAATAGHAEAQNSLGVRYEKGQGVAQDYALAVKWYREAAERKLGLAQDNLSDLYAKGLGVPKDLVLAHVWSNLASVNGEAGATRKRAAIEAAMKRDQIAEATTHLATMYLRGRGVAADPKRAVQLFTRAANQGFAIAQFELAECYDKGTGVPQDPLRAAEWYEKAARQGNDRAQASLGYLYDVGIGVQQNMAQALQWYHMAAANGNAVAQYNLGSMHANGHGVQQNVMQAAMWFNIVEVNADTTRRGAAEQARRQVEAQMTAEQIAESKRLAREWVKTNIR